MPKHWPVSFDVRSVSPQPPLRGRDVTQQLLASEHLKPPPSGAASFFVLIRNAQPHPIRPGKAEAGLANDWEPAFPRVSNRGRHLALKSSAAEQNPP